MIPSRGMNEHRATERRCQAASGSKGAAVRRASRRSAESRRSCDTPALLSSISKEGSGLDQRTARGRSLGPSTAAIRAARLRLALACDRQLLRLRRDRTLDEFEADLLRAFRTRLVLDQDDTNVTAALELAEQHLVRQRLLDVLLDHARHRPRSHLLVITCLLYT